MPLNSSNRSEMESNVPMHHYEVDHVVGLDDP